MHEMSIAQGIVDIAIDIANEHNSQEIKAIHLQLGVMAGVVEESLLFCFAAITKGTIAEGAVLEIEKIPLTARCLDCHHSFDVEGYVFQCPLCKSRSVTTETGREMRVTSIDIE